MSKIRKKHSKHVKFKAELEVVKSDRTLAELSHEFGVYQTVLHKWKKQLLEEGCELFENRRKKRHEPDDKAALERKISQLTMELDFLKKALAQYMNRIQEIHRLYTHRTSFCGFLVSSDGLLEFNSKPSIGLTIGGF